MDDVKRLYDAAWKGELKPLDDLLKEDPSILDRVSFTCSKKTPLHIASAKGYIAIVRALVSAAPDMCLARDSQGRNPLHLAAINGQETVFGELNMRSPLSVREKVDRGETVLHLCVKHNQLQVMRNITQDIHDDEFVNAKNDDGDTILHLAVRDKNLEAVQHLMGNTGIDVNAKNANGYSALDILELTPTELRATNNYLPIKNCLHQPSAYKSLNRQKPETKWLKLNSIMVVAILIATMSLQAGLTPPGGVWQDNATDNSHQAGEAVMAHFRPKIYRFFLVANTISFTSSLSMILLLTSGLPLGNRYTTYSLMVFLWISLISTSIVYGASIREVTPEKDMKTTRERI